MMLTVAYALAVGNAGTGFRYRTDILPFAIAAIIVLREQLEPVPASQLIVPPGGPLPAPTRWRQQQA